MPLYVIKAVDGSYCDGEFVTVERPLRGGPLLKSGGDRATAAKWSLPADAIGAFQSHIGDGYTGDVGRWWNLCELDPETGETRVVDSLENLTRKGDAGGR